MDSTRARCPEIRTECGRATEPGRAGVYMVSDHGCSLKLPARVPLMRTGPCMLVGFGSCRSWARPARRRCCGLRLAAVWSLPCPLGAHGRGPRPSCSRGRAGGLVCGAERPAAAEGSHCPGGGKGPARELPDMGRGHVAIADVFASECEASAAAATHIVRPRPSPVATTPQASACPAPTRYSWGARPRRAPGRPGPRRCRERSRCGRPSSARVRTAAA